MLLRRNIRLVLGNPFRWMTLTANLNASRCVLNNIWVSECLNKTLQLALYGRCITQESTTCPDLHPCKKLLTMTGTSKVFQLRPSINYSTIKSCQKSDHTFRIINLTCTRPSINITELLGQVTRPTIRYACCQ